MKEIYFDFLLLAIVCILSVSLGYGLSESRHRRHEIFSKDIPTFILSENCKQFLSEQSNEWDQMDLFDCVYYRSGGRLPDIDYDWRTGKTAINPGNIRHRE